MPNIGDPIVNYVTGVPGVVIAKDINYMGKQFATSGAYDGIPRSLYGVRWFDGTTSFGIADDDFGGQIRRFLVNQLDDPTVPWASF